MAVRFILGRAGTGKTAHCLTQIVRALQTQPLGPPLVWIVPDQMTFIAERMLVNHPAIRGAFRAQVTSFRRLATLLAADLGLAAGEDLDDLSRIILLTDLVLSLKPQLQLFGPVADRPGFIVRLDAMLRELQQAAHTGVSLRAAADHLSPAPAGNPADPILIRKLHDLALLLDGWDALLRERRFPSERLQDIVASRLHELPAMQDACIWVDAFSAFSQLEVRLLAAMARHCSAVEITLILDPLEKPILTPATPLDEMALFHRTQQAYRGLLKAFAQDGTKVLPPLILPHRHRFTRAPDLDRVESGLFGPPAPANPAPPANLELWQCASPLVEVRAAAQHIRRLMTDPAAPLRYRDIALIIPDLEGYSDAVRRIFTQHDIPHFIDQRRGIAHHPLVELLRSAVRLPLEGFANDDIAILLKTGLTPVDPRAADLLENHLLAHGLTRVDLHRPFAFPPPEENEDDIAQPPSEAQLEILQTIDTARLALLETLKRWLAVAENPDPTTGDRYAAGLQHLLEDMAVAPAMEKLIAQAKAAGDVELVMIHTQAHQQVIELLEALSRLLAGRTTTLEEFGGILGSALENLTLGLIPPTLDQVLVSSVTRSRHPELKVAIILGAVESRFPMVRAEDPLLNDHQRAAFNAITLQPVAPGSDRQLLEARFFDYIAFTRSSDRLVVSYPLADLQGRAVTRSPYVQRLEALFPALKTAAITEETLHGLDCISTLDDALAAALLWARSLENQAAQQPSFDFEPAAAPQMDLYAWLVTDPQDRLRQAADRALPSLRPPVEPSLSPAIAQAFFPGPIRMSVSQLEKYASCPLQYFLQYTLGLRERPLLQLDVMNLGTLYHGVLEKFFDQVIAGALPWPDCSAADMQKVLRHAADSAARELHAELADTLPQYPKVLQRTIWTLGIVLESQRRAALAGKLRPVATELTFGLGDARNPRPGPSVSLPVLKLSTPAGRSAHLNGKIDRVDVAGRHAAVIDYKSSQTRELALHQLLAGIQLQLPVYLLAIEALGAALGTGPLTPIAALFVPLARARRSKANPGPESDPANDAFYQQTKPRGLIDAAAIRDLDASVDDDNRKSQWYAYSRKKNTDLGARSNDAYEHDDFATILRYTRLKAGTIVDALAAGGIAPHPYRDKTQIPCDFCDVKAMCQFDRIRGAFLNVPKLKREEVLQQMHNALQDAAGGGDTHGQE